MVMALLYSFLNAKSLLLSSYSMFIHVYIIIVLVYTYVGANGIFPTV